MSSQLPTAPASPGSRPLSGLERVWLTGGRLLPPFAFEWVLEGEGALEEDRLRDAIARVAAVLPAVRGRPRGWLWGARWTWTGPVPPVRTVHAPGWEGLRESAALDGPLQGVELLRVDDRRLVLRVEHALMDGRGSLVVLRALFAALRGAAIAPEEFVSDRELVADLGVKAEPPPPRDALPAVRLDGGTGRRWVRRSVPGSPGQVLPRAVLALAEHSRAVAERSGIVRIDVPVDLRRHRPGLRCTANLTGFARVTVEPGDDRDRVREGLQAELDRHGGAAAVATADAFRSVPLWLMAAVGRSEARKGQRLGLHGSSGTVSSLGRIDLDWLACPGWQTRRAFVIPPANPDLPLLMTMTGHDHGIELCGTSPGTADPTAAVEAVAAALAGSAAPNQ